MIMNTKYADMMGYFTLSSAAASLMFVWAMFQQYFPQPLRELVDKYRKRAASFFNPYVQVTFNEFPGEHLPRSDGFSAIENYLSLTSPVQAKRLKADVRKNSLSLILSMDDNEEVADEFQGARMWWSYGKQGAETPTSYHHRKKRYYRVTFHKRHRELVQKTYLEHVLKEGKAIGVKNRRRKLHTNNGSYWSHVDFQHPATFRTLAMKPGKKKDIVDELMAFSKAEEFYANIGRAWTRGYLLYGPPGTGKSTMVAAMADLLGYDIYDLELAAVKDNTELRKLLLETSSKSITVVEDIDCSVDLTGNREKRKGREETKALNPGEDDSGSGVTLSGLLNFIDGLWSACGGERLIVFTTNYIEKLDPALIRKGRMDNHIEMSYCGFEEFKVLAENYLHIECHPLFQKVGELLEQVHITPADVAEHLMPNTQSPDAQNCLKSLVEALEDRKKSNGETITPSAEKDTVSVA